MDWANTILNASTLLAAASAAIFSYLSFKKHGKQRVAEFRQQWIENFRIHLSAFNGDIYRKEVLQDQVNALRKKGSPVPNAIKNEIRAAIEEAGEHYEYLKLCLNSNEPAHLEFNKKLSSLLNGKPGDRKLKPKATDLGVKIIKTEWERIKTDLN